MMKVQQKHGFPPYYNRDSEILILGSFPSVLSRRDAFYYMHPQNRFWKLLEMIFNDHFEAKDIEIKKQLLRKYKIALYDVIESCDIQGSSDATIENVVPADIHMILNHSNIKRIFLNGVMAKKLFNTYHFELLEIAKPLPSTSSANARYTIEKLYLEWKIINL